MAGTIKRAAALCGGELIKIESIYTVTLNGDQINIAGKVEELRNLGRQGKLTCPCGCGTILHLVAPDSYTKAQHFAANRGQDNKNCTLPSISKTTLYAKIVLKCWMEDKLRNSSITDNTPLYTVNDTTRKYEYSLLAEKAKTAINYWSNRKNILDEKLNLQNNYSSDIKVIYILDYTNSENQKQYPEHLIKIQKHQGCCLFLKAKSDKYDEALIKAYYYATNYDGEWDKHFVVNGKLKDFYIENGEIHWNYDGKKYSLKDKLQTVLDQQKKKDGIRIVSIETKPTKKDAPKIQNETPKYRENRNFAISMPSDPNLLAKIEENTDANDTIGKEAYMRYFHNKELSKSIPMRDYNGKHILVCECCGTTKPKYEFKYTPIRDCINLGICEECSICPNCNSALEIMKQQILKCSNKNCTWYRSIPSKKHHFID